MTHKIETEIDPRQAAFEGIRQVCPVNPFNDPGNIHAVHNLLDAFGAPRELKTGSLTLRGALELADHESIVLEAYRDSQEVWTWGIGVTNRSPHKVFPRYQDNPQSLEWVLEVYCWLVLTQYLPDVLDTFKGVPLTENELTGALSFHYNTGAIARADWVKSFKKGNRDRAYDEIMNWTANKELTDRRKKEQALIFNNTWSGDGRVMIWPVRKPSYHPDWGNGRNVDIREPMQAALSKVLGEKRDA